MGFVDRWLEPYVRQSSVNLADGGTLQPLNHDPLVSGANPSAPIVHPALSREDVFPPGTDEFLWDAASYIAYTVTEGAIQRGFMYSSRIAMLVAESSALTYIATLGRGGLKALPIIGWALLIWDIHHLLEDLGVPRS